jgi:hypothetical protein
MSRTVLEFLKSFLLFAFKASFVFLLVIILVVISGNFLFGQQRAATEPSLFNVQGTAKRKVTPDMAVLSIGTTVEGTNIAQLQQDANTKINNTQKALKELGIADDKIQTSSYNLNPKYDSNGNKINSYSLNIQLQVEVDNLDPQKNIAGAVISAGSANGLNEVRGLSFDLQNREKIQDELKVDAINDGKAKKDTLASASGIRLGELKNVSFDNFVYPYFGASGSPIATDSTKAEAPTSVIVNPGQTELSATVTLQYEIL